MLPQSFWITGPTRSGKTSRLVTQFAQWVDAGLGKLPHPSHSATAKTWRDRQRASAILILAANDDNRRDFADRLTTAVQGHYPVLSKTPLGFFQDEVMVYWPLLIGRLDLKAQFPLRLRPETENELAAQFWQTELDQGLLDLPGVHGTKRVRRLLDLYQLAAVSGTPITDIPLLLSQGMTEPEWTLERWEFLGQRLIDWRGWCLEKGLLTYGLIGELYAQELLPDPRYREYLKQRYRGIIADDVDDYPAIARDLFELLLDFGAVGAFTYNPNGQIRLGLNADPDYLAGLATRCQVESLTTHPHTSLASELSTQVTEWIEHPPLGSSLPEAVQSLQTTSRAQLLRQTAQTIIEAVKSGQVQPADIAIIAPGLDAIAHYTLTEILTHQGICVEPLNDQRPLIASPPIRALLTLLALVYPGLGRLVDREAIAQMLVVLSQKPDPLTPSPDSFPTPQIDPVRAGLLADYCYVPNPDSPRLLPVESFARWDRLGHRAAAAYTEIVQWLETQRNQQHQRTFPSCMVVLDRAIQTFLWQGTHLPYDQLAALRELMETAQHYWDVEGRLGREAVQKPGSTEALTASPRPPHTTIARFIQLLRQGTVTANPYPVRRLPSLANQAVTLATIFQYRAARCFHPWHFWLDAGSPLWLSGGAATLWGASLFLKDWSGHPWTEADKIQADEARLQRILQDLLGRVGDRLYLCHSELAVNGTEQTGPLLTLVHGAMTLGTEPILSYSNGQIS